MISVFRARTKKNKRKIPPGLGETYGMQGKNLWRWIDTTQRDVVQRLAGMRKAHGRPSRGRSKGRGMGWLHLLVGRSRGLHQPCCRISDGSASFMGKIPFCAEMADQPHRVVAIMTRAPDQLTPRDMSARQAEESSVGGEVRPSCRASLRP